MRTLIPKDSVSPGQSLEVVHTHLQRGRDVIRSLWVKVTPRNPVLKLILAPPLFLTAGMILLLMLVVICFTLMALAVFWMLMKKMLQEGEK